MGWRSFPFLCAALLLLAACGGGEPVEPPAPSPEPPPTSTPQAEATTEEEVYEVITGGDDEPREVILEGQRLELFFGVASIQERIVNSDAVVRATMDTVVSEIIHDADEKYRIALKFTFTVHEYLQGSGANSMVAYWVDGREYETNAAATADIPRITAWRDAQWDDREAILFLNDDHSHLEYLGADLDDTLSDADIYLISVGMQYARDDNYSLFSERWRAWLPSTTAPSDESEGVSGQSVTTTREYLLDVPVSDGASDASGASDATPTITLADLKTQINTLNDAINGSSDPEGYRECLVNAFLDDRIAAYHERQGRTYDERDRYGRPHIEISAPSGQPADTVINAEPGYGTGGVPDEKTRMWLEGGDADLFIVTEGPQSPYTGDEAWPNAYTFDFQFKNARPLPAGEYTTSREELWLGNYYYLCEKSTPLNWTLTITAPEGTVYEAFFDPIATGFGSGGGELAPATFTADGTTSTITGLTYDDGKVVLETDPFNRMEGLNLYFIELDGSTGLVLSASSAKVDAVAGTLTWLVADRPWQAGDQLMLRISVLTP